MKSLPASYVMDGWLDSHAALPDNNGKERKFYYVTLLVQVSIFKECQPEFLHDLVLKMRASIFTPGDMICRRGEVAREMFIIADGILEVIRLGLFFSFYLSWSVYRRLILFFFVNRVAVRREKSLLR